MLHLLSPQSAPSSTERKERQPCATVGEEPGEGERTASARTGGETSLSSTTRTGREQRNLSSRRSGGVAGSGARSLAAVGGDPVSCRYVAVLLRITKQPNVSWIRSMVREPTLQGTGRRFWSPTPIPFSPTPLPGRATHAGTAFSRAMP